MSEGRKIARRRVLKLGTISFNRGGGITCRIRDISEGGACLEVASQFGIPDDFNLVIGPDNWHCSCHVAWRKANRIGVAFDQSFSSLPSVVSPPTRAGRL
ncbi:MAG: PilZ domain-containing protein [Xanthobacteraceae bacterium]